MTVPGELQDPTVPQKIRGPFSIAFLFTHDTRDLESRFRENG